jgi:hypothetical protein
MGAKAFQFADKRPETLAQRRQRDLMQNSAKARQLNAFAEMANQHNSGGPEIIQRVKNLVKDQQVRYIEADNGRIKDAQIESVKNGGATYELALPTGNPMIKELIDLPQNLVFPNTTSDAIGCEGAGYMLIGGLAVEIVEDYMEPDLQQMGGNLAFERAALKDYMFTDGGRGTMQVDLTEGGKLEGQMRKHRAMAGKKGLLGGEPDPPEKFKRLLNQVKAVATNKQKRDEQVMGGVENLADMIDLGYTMCWEKAMFLHLLLADFGVSTVIHIGEMKKNKSAQHAWLVTADRNYVIEATAGFVALSANYNKTFTTNQKKIVAKPKRAYTTDSVVKIIANSKLLNSGFVPTTN